MSNLSQEQKKFIKGELSKCQDFSKHLDKIDLIESEPTHYKLAQDLLKYAELHRKKRDSEYLSSQEKKIKIHLKTNLENDLAKLGKSQAVA